MADEGSDDGGDEDDTMLSPLATQVVLQGFCEDGAAFVPGALVGSGCLAAEDVLAVLRAEAAGQL